MQEWVDETDVDGFNLAYAITPGDVRATSSSTWCPSCSAAAFTAASTRTPRCATACSGRATACPSSPRRRDVPAPRELAAQQHQRRRDGRRQHVVDEEQLVPGQRRGEDGDRRPELRPALRGEDAADETGDEEVAVARVPRRRRTPTAAGAGRAPARRSTSTAFAGCSRFVKTRYASTAAIA